VKKLSPLLLSAALAACPVHLYAQNSTNLPSLGDSTSGTISLEKEHQLGRLWLAQMRASTPQVEDPLVYDYVSYLLYRLASYSELQDRRLELTLIDSQQLNAFAVPGGIIGVNGGLFLHADTEDEFASVLAHELAHLSQRHYSRGVEASQRNSVAGMAAVLASIAIMVAGGGDAGIAALSATQAAMIENQLRFSRSNEQEADRIGIQNLAKAGIDPDAMADMFQSMLASQRLSGNETPEFLMTHPVTESRVSDARSRAAQYDSSTFNQNELGEYALIRNRLRLRYFDSTNQAIKTFETELSSADPVLSRAARYGLALAYQQANRPQDADKTLAPLLAEDPNRISYIVAYAETHTQPDQLEAAEQVLKKNLKLNPNNYALTMTLAENLWQQKKYAENASLLTELSKTYPDVPEVWYQLAEAEGLSGNILAVHQARAEYFIVTGNYKEAEEQLRLAQRRAGTNFPLNARLDARLREVLDYREQLRQLQ